MSIRLTRIEAWALDIVSRVQSGARVEDTRVELKSQWPPPEKAARRIAGHANSCFGADILWIIGLDEEKGVVGAPPDEIANWWPATCSYFDGVAPTLTDIVLPVEKKSLVCLYFETSRPPYVVKNPKFGSQGGGAVAWEVPWREGTSTRSAARNDLIRILVPTLAQPVIEVMGGGGSLTTKQESYPGDEKIGVSLSFNLTIYVYPRSDASIVIPFHRCQCVLNDDHGRNAFDEFDFTMYYPSSFSIQGSRADTATMERTSNELIAHGPGQCSIRVNAVLEFEPSWMEGADLRLRFMLFVIDSELPVEIEVELTPEQCGSGDIRRWSIKSGV